MDINKIKRSNTINALKLALDFEAKGSSLYMDLATRTKNSLAKKLFYTLAKQEIEHAETFDEIHNQLKQNQSWNNIMIKRLPGVEKEIKNYFRSADKKKIKTEKANLSGYRLAIDMEKTSYNAYNELYKKSKTDKEKQFFKQLMKEENSHLEALQNVYHYLTSPGDWFQENESHVWNWMNI